MTETKKPGLLQRWFGFGTRGSGPAATVEPESPKQQMKAGSKPSHKPSHKPSAKTSEKPAPKRSRADKPSAGAAPVAKSPASKSPASKSAAGKSPAGKSVNNKTSETKPTAKASKAAPKVGALAGETSIKTGGAKRPGGGASTASEKREAADKVADMQPKNTPPPAAPTRKKGEPRPEEVSPSRRTHDAPEADDEAGPASPRPTRPEGEPEPPEREKTTPAAPPAGPGPVEGEDDDAEEAGPTAPEPKPEKPERAQSSARSEAQPQTRGWFAQLRQGLSRTSNALSENLASVLTKRRLDEETLDDIEEVLIRADLGVAMAGRVREAIAQSRFERGVSADAVRGVLADEVAKVLEPVAQPFPEPDRKPYVWLVIGVNGTGKTTTIGKLAHRFKRSGKSVMLAAADTFRAAAIDQLKIWGDRVGAEVVANAVGSDPAGVAYAGLERARDEDVDILMIDTAGRLQNKSDLMAELAKIVRVLRKLDDSAPHGVLLVLDATTGQNALSQVELFREIAGVTGLVVTKLDGTARGGILIPIAERFGLPVHAIGVGEGIDDLESFDASDFARAVAGAEDESAVAA